jgi:hypothetical protein
MGGLGSGRIPGFGKTRVEDCLVLNTDFIQQKKRFGNPINTFGVLTWTLAATGEQIGCVSYELDSLEPSFPWLGLYYTIRRTGESIDYKIRLQATRPNFGGLRWWFLCPVEKSGAPCHYRARKLYLPPGGRYFGCRHCYDLTYKSCQESHMYDRLYLSLSTRTGLSLERVKQIVKERFLTPRA